MVRPQIIFGIIWMRTLPSLELSPVIFNFLWNLNKRSDRPSSIGFASNLKRSTPPSSLFHRPKALPLFPPSALRNFGSSSFRPSPSLVLPFRLFPTSALPVFNPCPRPSSERSGRPSSLVLGPFPSLTPLKAHPVDVLIYLWASPIALLTGLGINWNRWLLGIYHQKKLNSPTESLFLSDSPDKNHLLNQSNSC